MADLLGGIMPMIGSIFPIPGMTDSASAPASKSGAAGATGTAGTPGGGFGDLIGSVLNMFGLGDVLKGFGLSGTTSTTAPQAQSSKHTGDSAAKPASTGPTLDALMSALGAGGSSTDNASLAAAALPPSQPAPLPSGMVPRLQPRASASIDARHLGSLPWDVPSFSM